MKQEPMLPGHVRASITVFNASTPAEIVRRLNKPVTAWSALGVGILTIWNTPGLKEWFAYLITQPTLQSLTVLVGALVTGFLLYVSRPAGV